MLMEETEFIKLYYSIGEVSEKLGVNTSLIRFWEKEFKEIKPKKNERGKRYYTASDIQVLQKIYHLVKEEGHTLQGARDAMGSHSSTEKNLADIKLNLQNIREKLMKLEQEL